MGELPSRQLEVTMSENLKARLAHLEDRIDRIEQAETATDAEGQQWSVPKLVEMGLTRRQAMLAVGTLAVYGGSIWGAIKYATGNARAATDQVGTPSQPADVFADSLSAESLVDDRHYAGAYPGGDPSTRLSNALSAATGGDVIHLEAATYTSGLTISNTAHRGLRLVGPGHAKQGNATVLAASWTLSTLRVQIERVRVESGSGGSLSIDGNGSRVVECSEDVTIGGDRVLVYGHNGGQVTFESGTSGGLVDASINVTVTDSGANTEGDTT